MANCCKLLILGKYLWQKEVCYKKMLKINEFYSNLRKIIFVMVNMNFMKKKGSIDTKKVKKMRYRRFLNYLEFLKFQKM